MSKANFDDNDRTFFQRYRVVILLGSIALGATWIFFPSQFFKKSTPTKKANFEMVRVSLPPPPPPPPPPPKQEQPPQKEEEKMIEQEAVQEDEPKPEEAPPDEPPAAPDLSTGIVGNGPADGFGLGGPGGGRGGNGLGGGGRRGGGSKYGWYAAQVQSRIADALRGNKQTSRADVRIEVRIWPDETGRIRRASLARSTGDAALDRVIESEVLTGLRLSEPPPADMPLPIVMRITARRPN